jgi:hypothetical protein
MTSERSSTVDAPSIGAAETAPPRFGFLDGTYAYNARDQYWEDVTRLGATILRYNLYWPEVAPTPPAVDARDPGDPSYRWDQFDAWLRDAAAHDVPVLVTIWQTPPWAERDPQIGGRNSMPRLAAFRDFVAAAADRYAGDHDLDGDGPLAPLPRVTRWEVWNEPNMYLFPARRSGRLTIAEDYAALVDAAYEELHRSGTGTGSSRPSWSARWPARTRSGRPRRPCASSRTCMPQASRSTPSPCTPTVVTGASAPPTAPCRAARRRRTWRSATSTP